MSETPEEEGMRNAMSDLQEYAPPPPIKKELDKSEPYYQPLNSVP